MMSRVPMGSNNGSMSPLVWERHEIVMQGISAEEIAKEWGLTREELDRISFESHMRAARAIDDARFEREIVPIELDVPAADSGTTLVRTRFAVDEAVRRETTLEKMASLQPAFIPEGVVTAGNSSQIVDGSAAVLVASEAKVAELGLEPRARFVSFGVVGVDPHLMLHGNPEASAKALAKAGLEWDDIDVIEVNEAFASVVGQFLADTGLQERYEAGDVNPNGGGISLGHPLGATGARITATLVSELERREARYGLATMCIGFGQAIAAVIERV
jgi:acetyl-CoA acetyltransferase family protein